MNKWFDDWFFSIATVIIVLAWTAIAGYSIYKYWEDEDVTLCESAKCVVVTNDSAINDLQKTVNDNRDLFINSGGIVVGENFVAVVDKDTLALQVVQSPVKRISSVVQETPKPNNEETGAVGAKE